MHIKGPVHQPTAIDRCFAFHKPLPPTSFRAWLANFPGLGGEATPLTSAEAARFFALVEDDFERLVVAGWLRVSPIIRRRDLAVLVAYKAQAARRCNRSVAEPSQPEGPHAVIERSV